MNDEIDAFDVDAQALRDKWAKWGKDNPPKFSQRADGTVFVVGNEPQDRALKENKNPAMKGNRNPFGQNSVRSMKTR